MDQPLTRSELPILTSQHRTGLVAGLVALIGFLMVAGAQAQVAIEEVIVTATKRGAVSVQDLAIGIQAIGGETIDQYNFHSVVRSSAACCCDRFAPGSASTGEQPARMATREKITTTPRVR